MCNKVVDSLRGDCYFWIPFQPNVTKIRETESRVEKTGVAKSDVLLKKNATVPREHLGAKKNAYKSAPDAQIFSKSWQIPLSVRFRSS